MSPSVDPILDPPLLFATAEGSRGAGPGSPHSHNIAADQGADGVHTEATLEEAGRVLVGPAPRRFRRTPARLDLTDLYEDPDAKQLSHMFAVDRLETAEAVLDISRRHTRIQRLWICSGDVELLEVLRSVSPAVRLLHHSDPAREPLGAEQHAARLRTAGIDGVLVEENNVSAGLVALMHRFGRLVVAHGAHYERTARRALGHGVDAVTGANPLLLVAARNGQGFRAT